MCLNWPKASLARFATGVQCAEHADALDAWLLPWFLARTRQEAMHACQARRIPVGLSCTMPDLLADPLAVPITKELAWRGLELSLAEGLRLYAALGALVRASEDARKGPRAFAEKRQPQFEGR